MFKQREFIYRKFCGFVLIGLTCGGNVMMDDFCVLSFDVKITSISNTNSYLKKQYMYLLLL